MKCIQVVNILDGLDGGVEWEDPTFGAMELHLVPGGGVEWEGGDSDVTGYFFPSGGYEFDGSDSSIVVILFTPGGGIEWNSSAPLVVVFSPGGGIEWNGPAGVGYAITVSISGGIEFDGPTFLGTCATAAELTLGTALGKFVFVDQFWHFTTTDGGNYHVYVENISAYDVNVSVGTYPCPTFTTSIGSATPLASGDSICFDFNATDTPAAGNNYYVYATAVEGGIPAVRVTADHDSCGVSTSGGIEWNGDAPVETPPATTGSCSKCPGGALLTWKVVISGVTNSGASDCANMNGTWYVPYSGSGCAWTLANAFTLNGSPAELKVAGAGDGNWYVRVNSTEMIWNVADAGFNCMTGGTFSFLTSVGGVCNGGSSTCVVSAP